MDGKLKEDSQKKHEMALGQERKRILMLEQLEQKNGPFTNTKEVEELDIPEKEKQGRMQKEIQFARDSSTTVTIVDALFKIQGNQKNLFLPFLLF